MHIGLLLEM